MVLNYITSLFLIQTTTHNKYFICYYRELIKLTLFAVEYNQFKYVLLECGYCRIKVLPVINCEVAFCYTITIIQKKKHINHNKSKGADKKWKFPENKLILTN